MWWHRNPSTRHVSMHRRARGGLTWVTWEATWRWAARTRATRTAATRRASASPSRRSRRWWRVCASTARAGRVSRPRTPTSWAAAHRSTSRTSGATYRRAWPTTGRMSAHRSPTASRSASASSRRWVWARKGPTWLQPLLRHQAEGGQGAPRASRRAAGSRGLAVMAVLARAAWQPPCSSSPAATCWASGALATQVWRRLWRLPWLQQPLPPARPSWAVLGAWVVAAGAVQRTARAWALVTMRWRLT
mmetsp:Transcript_33325/g.84450  ORF Transcript_33325/g.84450 Transcript_33325/m.84450 type:complete len:247 (+) Transcript_33325:1265-2005(+)